MPLKYGINGTLKSTKPLNYGGNLIEDFAFRFENGRIVDFTAEKGYETLKTLIEVDEGSHYLGEVALVPVNSPISNSNIIFYNTLFDENASCHFAIGNIYPLCIKDGAKMTKADFEKNGLNTSLVHVDFMVGCRELDIDGITEDGSIEAIFRGGNWAF
jgi:aminopeptidase